MSKARGFVICGCLFALMPGCGGSDPGEPGASTGSIRVTVATSGNSLDADGYSITLDGGGTEPVGSNGAVDFSTLQPGSHAVALGGVAANCTLAGTTSRDVAVAAGATAAVSFQISCTRIISNQIAFGRGGASSDIHLVVPTGSGLVQLTSDHTQNSQPAVSPDGRHIAFISTRSGSLGLYIMDSEGRNIRRLGNSLVNAGHPTWSPDGSKILFVAARATPDMVQPEIAVINADGTGLTYLTDNPGFEDSPTWSPDGSRIAFFSGVDGVNGLYFMNADGTGRTLMANSHNTDTSPAWSPDGTRLAFSSARDGWWEIYTVAIDGSDLKRLTTNSNTISDFSPSWSPDGSRLVFSSDRAGALALYIMNADGTGVAALSAAGSPAEDPSWSK